MNRTNFLGLVFGTMQICIKLSEEMLWNIISKCCLHILLQGVDYILLYVYQVHKLSATLSLATGVIDSCFHMAKMGLCVICYIFLEICR